MEKKYLVYIHKCPNNKIYVGTTSRKTYQRWQGGNGYKFNKEFTNDIKKYGWKNIEHIVVKENLCQEEAYKLEQELIKKYNSTNFNYGYNKQNGGEKNKNTIEIKKEMSNAKKGKKLSEETKKKLSLQKLGNKNPMYGKRPANCKQIVQYDLNNNIIKIWGTISDIEKKLKLPHTNIVKVCKKNRKTCGGYKWSYYNE